MNEFPLEIVTPTKLVDEGMVEYVRCPGLDGSFGVMAHHRSAIIALGIGEIKVTQNKKDHYLATSGGFVEITKEKVQLLVETVERSDEIDSNRAKDSMSRAKMRKEEKTGALDQSRMDISIARAVNRLKVSQR
jgi:F-type H+-transporting ATPase subunit epsilon|tara:strand:- start:41 stop:439 length:399 start_codon:yes stop_codon:yes gene_type:complete